MRKGVYFAINLVLGLSLVGCGSASTTSKSASNTTSSNDKVYTLRAGLAFGEGNPWYSGFTYFADQLKKDSNGRIDLKVFGNGTLGGEPEMLKLAKAGNQDFVVADPAAGADLDDAMNFWSMPFLFTSLDQWQKALDGQPGQQWAQSINDKDGLKVLGYWGGSTRNVISKKPVNSIDDMKGLRLRILPSPLLVDMWKTTKAIPTPIAYNETYVALQNGTVDGLENETSAIKSAKFYEVAKNISLTEHNITVRPLFISKATWDKLPKDLQQIVEQDAKKATTYEREQEQKAGKEAMDFLKSQGVKVIEINKQPFNDATKPVREEYAKKWGQTNLLDEINNIK
jgi:tripartite ATP-independent transporter DctP family solute receptor